MTLDEELALEAELEKILNKSVDVVKISEDIDKILLKDNLEYISELEQSIKELIN